jgi:hypothetical protein
MLPRNIHVITIYSPVSSVGDDISAVVIPEYEEIILHEAKNIHLTDNAATLEGLSYFIVIHNYICAAFIIMIQKFKSTGRIL